MSEIKRGEIEFENGSNKFIEQLDAEVLDKQGQALAIGMIHHSKVVQAARKEIESLETQLAEKNAEITRLKEVGEENNRLRYLLSSIVPQCLYCGLSTMAECRAGFPGCGWMDDLNYETPELKNAAAKLRKSLDVKMTFALKSENAELKAENKRLEASNKNLCGDVANYERKLEYLNATLLEIGAENGRLKKVPDEILAELLKKKRQYMNGANHFDFVRAEDVQEIFAQFTQSGPFQAGKQYKERYK